MQNFRLRKFMKKSYMQMSQRVYFAFIQTKSRILCMIFNFTNKRWISPYIEKLYQRYVLIVPVCVFCTCGHYQSIYLSIRSFMHSFIFNTQRKPHSLVTVCVVLSPSLRLWEVDVEPGIQGKSSCFRFYTNYILLIETSRIIQWNETSFASKCSLFTAQRKVETTKIHTNQTDRNHSSS